MPVVHTADRTEFLEGLVQLHAKASWCVDVAGAWADVRKDFGHRVQILEAWKLAKNFN